VGRGHYTTRYDEDNCEALCVKCHQRLGANPNKHTDRKIMLIGYERYQELKRKQNLFIKKRDICTEEFYQEMKAKLKGLTDSFVYDGDEQC
jgi:hypothetical protein